MSEIAITGISGKVAKCKNLEEFKNALFAGTNMTTFNHNRWNCNFLKTPNALAALDGQEFFDAAFFGIPPNQAHGRDPRTRQLLEVAVESIFDAGINPQDLRGSKTGVILAVGEPMVEGLDRYIGVMANTISYCLDFKGPSYALNTGCSSSVYALNAAIESIAFGSCDNILVCAAQTQLLPGDSPNLNKWGVLSGNGCCRTFDDDRNGYVKGEAVVSIFLQKQENAKKIYATIAGIGCNVDGYKVDGMTNPSTDSQYNLLKYTYERCGLNPDDVEFMEAHGTGTLVGDVKECGAISKFFHNNTRQQPLKVGSVKTSTGHAENAAGLVSLLKLLVTIHTGVIPANKNFSNPAMDIPSVENGELEVVTKPTKYQGGLLALNSFGIGSANGHVVIRPYHKENIVSTISADKPRLVLVSGRTQDAVESLLTQAETHKNDLAFLTLLDQIFEKPINHHHYKGFKVLNRSSSSVQHFVHKMPMWFTYSGMGSQWFGMAKDLLQFDVFKESVDKCCKALQRYNIDLKYLLTKGTEEDFDDPENCFPAIIAMSIGLTDILYSLGIKPDKIIGHSLGEIGCAYADGLVTAEEAVLVAHARGLATKNTTLIPGLMAAVGLSVKECQKLLPEDIYIACDNSKQSVTVSGPKKSIETFVEKLKSDNVFAKIVNTAGIAFHSKYIHDAGPLLLNMLREILLHPKRRTEKWLPSAIEETEYSSYLGKFNSAEYQHHNFMNQVLYRNVLEKVPENVILLEVAPRGLFQAIFKRALPPSIIKINLVNKDVNDNGEYLLAAIGMLCSSNPISINLNALNESVSLPVDGKTPMIAPMIKWDHSLKWTVPKHIQSHYDGETLNLNLKNIKNKFMYGCIVNKTPIFSSAGLLFMAWQALANKLEKDMLEIPVKIKEVRLLKTVVLKDYLEFQVNILKSGNFEICEQGELVAEGNISILAQEGEEHISLPISDEPVIETDHFQKEFHLRGYKHVDTLTLISDINISGTFANIKWLHNWISFMDAMVQAVTFVKYSNLVLPSEYREVRIDPILHQRLANKKNTLQYNYNENGSTAVGGGIVLKGLTCTKIERDDKIQEPILSQNDFVSNNVEYNGEYTSHLEFSLLIALQIVKENNLNGLPTHIVEIKDSSSQILRDIILDLVHKMFSRTVKFTSITDLSQLQSNVNLVILPLDENRYSRDILDSINYPTFIFGKFQNTNLNGLNENVLFRCFKENTSFILARKSAELPKNYSIIETDTKNFQWIEKVKENIHKSNHTTFLISRTIITGLIGFFNCARRELIAKNLRVFILDSNSEEFSLNSNFYKKQIQKELTINILKCKNWYTYRILPLPKIERTCIQDMFYKYNGEKSSWVESCPYKSKDKIVLKYVSRNNRRLQIKDNFSDKRVEYQGYEFSGINKFGQNIIGISTNRCIATSVEPMLSWPIPHDIPLDDAATLPLDYSLAYYALFIKGKLQPNEIILIIGTNTLSLAAAALAIEHNCRVIIEVNRPEEINKLNSYFSNCRKPKYVYRSRLKEQINERDCVSQIDEVAAIFASEEQYLHKYHLDIISKNGRLLTIYKDNNKFTPEILHKIRQKQCEIYHVNLKNLSEQDKLVLQSSIQNYLNKGTLKPFKFLTKDIKDILSIDPIDNCINTKVLVKIDKREIIQKNFIRRKIYLNPHKSYIIVGGLGAVGLPLINWIIKNGATKLVINSRRSVTSGYAQFLFRRWRSTGVTIVINNYNAKNKCEAQNLINEALTLAPVGGIFNLAMVPKQNLFAATTANEFLEVVEPKLHVTQNLDDISRKLCPSLDHFVVFSAIATLGVENLCSYAFANSAVELICKERQSACLPALAVQWEFIGDVNYSAQHKLKNPPQENVQSLYSCLRTLEIFMLENKGVVCSSIPDESRLSVSVTEWDYNSNILDYVANIIGVEDISYLDKDEALSSLGLDSISALEIKNLLEDILHVSLTTRDVRKLTLNDLININDLNKND